MALRTAAASQSTFFNRLLAAAIPGRFEFGALVRPGVVGVSARDFMGEPAENDDLTTAPPTNDASTIGHSSASASVETVAAAHIREGPGTRVGLYKLLQLIGEGGFGSVFMAEQEQPVRRRVALKIIKLGMDTRQVVARFEQERQALALMDHPYIARVLDAGATDTGRPYFVMELVKGDPIVEYCDKGKLRIQARLELFEQVCTAVQHAHTKGIIHRDIKPSNVLVSTHDGRPHVKIIDFGIAKATAAKLTEKTLFTEHRQLIGTPQYMSPEQAEGSLDIDTRTDVYSLGVMLYELLTSSTPFTGAELRAAPQGDLQRMIREVEPPKPSTRLSRSVATLTDVAARRQVEPRMLGTLIRGELDWIVMKALEKDRERRYETANALALDIRRYLNGEVVMAAPPSAVYRFKKFLKRNRFQAAAAALIALTLVLGMAGTAWQAKRAADQRDLARSEAARADAAAKAETARAAELTVVSEFHETILDRIDPAVTGMRLTEEVNRRFAAALEKQGVPEAERAVQSATFRQQWEKLNATDLALTLIDETILKSAVEAIDEQFQDQPVVDALLRQVMADRYLDLGLVESAMPLQKQSLAIRRRVLGSEHPRTLDSINNMAILLQAAGRLEEAEPYYREGLEISRRVLGPEHPDTLTSMNNMGFLLSGQLKYTEAEPYHRAALEIRRRVLGSEHPETLSSLSNVGFLLLNMGEPAAAEPYLREALGTRRRVLGEEHPHTLLSLNALGVLLEHRGNLDEAERYYREALEKRRRLLGEQHPATLTSVMSLAVLLRGQGRNAEVVALLVPAEAAFRTAFADVNVQRLGQFLMHLGRARVGMGFDGEGFSAAETNLLEAHSILRITSGEQNKDTRDCVAGLVELFEAWNAADPEKGYDAKAAEWRQRLGGMPAAATAPDSDSSESDAGE